MNKFLLIVIFFVSCSHLTSFSLSYKDLEWDGQSSAKVKAGNKVNIKADIALLMYALENAYIGSDFIDKKIWDDFLQKIEKIPSNKVFKTNIELCKYLGELFLSLPDGHFDVWFPGHKCYQIKQYKSNIGKNYSHSSEKSIYMYKDFPSKKTKLLAIKKFFQAEDKRWNGFKNAIIDLKSGKNIIIDLRGNSGGDSRKGLELARALLNSTIEHNRREIIRKNTPEAWTIYRNGILRKRISFEYQKQTVKHIDDFIKKIDKDREESIRNPRKFLTYKFKRPSLNHIIFKGNIYVLVDRVCGSSCEHILEALRFHPNTKTVGQNTTGAIHYGQMGTLRLPSSGIYLRLATQYFKLFESGYYDKVGYAPDIFVPNGVDALGYTLNNVVKD